MYRHDGDNITIKVEGLSQLGDISFIAVLHCLQCFDTVGWTSGRASVKNSLKTERISCIVLVVKGGSIAEWLACWTQAQKARVQIAAATLSGNSLRQTVYTHCASVHQAAKLVAALLRVAGVTAGLAESNGRLPPGL